MFNSIKDKNVEENRAEYVQNNFQCGQSQNTSNNDRNSPTRLFLSLSASFALVSHPRPLIGQFRIPPPVPFPQRKVHGLGRLTRKTQERQPEKDAALSLAREAKSRINTVLFLGFNLSFSFPFFLFFLLQLTSQLYSVYYIL